jgi:hypothetical protein
MSIPSAGTRRFQHAVQVAPPRPLRVVVHGEHVFFAGDQGLTLVHCLAQLKHLFVRYVNC